MSTQFRRLEIPPGVVALPTKQMGSSNWAEVNLMRWREGQMLPVGGQQQYNYTFASPCKAVHSWYSLSQVLYIAYLCETNLYVDFDGELVEITPTGGMQGGTFVEGGYGVGAYGAGIYGGLTELDQSVLLDKVPDAFSLHNFGGVLLAMTSTDGRLLQWDPGAGVPGPSNLATVVAAAPNGRCFVVTPERFVQIFGAYGPMSDGGSFRRFAWCDQENFNNWTFADVTSQAGYLDLEPASPIITAISTRTGTLFWTGKKAYVSQFLGLPYVYNSVELADNCTPWSPQSMVTTSLMVLWMSEQGAFSYDGTSIYPVQCMVRPWVDEDIDDVYVRQQACAVHVENFSEFWWFFPQNGQSSNTRAIIYSYKEGWWSQAQMARSAGVSAAYNVRTIMANGTVAYQHELGTFYSQDAALPFAETFDLNITPDGRLITVKQIIPDIETMEAASSAAIAAAIQSLRYTLYYRNSRSLGAAEQQSPLMSVRPDGYVDCRTTGRDIRLRFDIVTPNVPLLTIGQTLIDAVPRGDR